MFLCYCKNIWLYQFCFLNWYIKIFFTVKQKHKFAPPPPPSCSYAWGRITIWCLIWNHNTLFIWQCFVLLRMLYLPQAGRPGPGWTAYNRTGPPKPAAKCSSQKSQPFRLSPRGLWDRRCMHHTVYHHHLEKHNQRAQNMLNKYIKGY